MLSPLCSLSWCAVLVLATDLPPQSDPIRLRVQILAADGSPLAGARLVIGRREELPGDAARQAAAPRSASNGHLLAEVPHPHHHGDLFAMLSAPGHASRLLRIGSTDLATAGGTGLGNTFDLGTLRLAPAGRVRGMVRDGAGRPVAGAQVETLDALAAPQVAIPNHVAFDLGSATIGRTAADGSFEFTDVPPRGITMVARKPGYFATRLAFVDPRQPAILTLQPGGQVHGRILTAAGTPAARTRFAILYERDHRSIYHLTDAAGRFAIDLEHPGRYRISVPAASRGMPAQFSAPLTGPTSGVEVQLTPQSGIPVRVVDAADRPVARFRVTAVWPPPGRAADVLAGDLEAHFAVAHVSASAPGRAAVPGPVGRQPRRGFLHVRAPGFAPATVPIDLDAAEPGTSGQTAHTVRLIPGSQLAGSCRGATSGEPRAGVRIEVGRVAPAARGQRRAPGTVQPVWTDDQGRFTVPDLADGDYELRLDPLRWPMVPAQRIAVRAGTPVEPVAFRLPAGVRVTLRLTTPVPLPWRIGLAPRIDFAANPRLRLAWLRQSSADSAAARRPDDQNRLRFDDVLPGSYQLECLGPRADGSVLRYRLADLEVGAEPIEQPLAAADRLPGRVRGKVTFQDVHLPPGRLLLALVAADQRAIPVPLGPVGMRLHGAPVTPGTDGTFALPAEPGEYRLLAVDLATGVVLHESIETIGVEGGETVDHPLHLRLVYTRLRLVPEPDHADMAPVHRLQFAVRHGAQTELPRPRMLNSFDLGNGLPLQPGQNQVELFLPPVPIRVAARNSTHHVTGAQRSQPVGEVEFEPEPGRTLRVDLPIRPPVGR